LPGSTPCQPAPGHDPTLGDTSNGRVQRLIQTVVPRPEIAPPPDTEDPGGAADPQAVGELLAVAAEFEALYHPRRGACQAAYIEAAEPLAAKGETMFARLGRWSNLFTRALGAALLLGACGVSALTPAAAQTPAVLRMARNAEPGIFIPWLIDDNTALFTMGNVYDGLLRVTKDGASVEPALATSW